MYFHIYETFRTENTQVVSEFVWCETGGECKRLGRNPLYIQDSRLRLCRPEGKDRTGTIGKPITYFLTTALKSCCGFVSCDYQNKKTRGDVD